MNEYPELLVSFEDVAVAFTWEEWQNLVDGQKTLYRNVMLETYSSLVSLGQCVTKPELIFKLEQGAEPWTEAESPNRSLPGIQKIEDRIERSEKSQNRYLCRVEFTNTNIPVEENVELENTFHLSSHCKLRSSISNGNYSDVKSKEFNVCPNTCLLSIGEKPDDCDKRKLCLEYHEHFSQHHKIHTGQRDCAYMGQGKASNKEAEFTENWIDQKQVHRTQTSEHKSLTIHQRTHGGDRPQGSIECGKTFHRKSKLSSDQTIPTGREPHECNECGKTFFYVSHLRKHCLIHRGEKPYECIDCGKTFLWNSRLKYHQRTHTNEKPFKCDECGKTFTQKTFLSQHQKTHTGEKRYVCNYCGRPFLQKSHLTYHTAIHTGEKHYVCNHCQKTFRQKSSLTTHELIHTGKKPYECHKCQKTFRHKSSLVNHELIHSGEKPFECIKCQKTFRHKSSLTNHELIHIGEKT